MNKKSNKKNEKKKSPRTTDVLRYVDEPWLEVDVSKDKKRKKLMEESNKAVISLVLNYFSKDRKALGSLLMAVEKVVETMSNPFTCEIVSTRLAKPLFEVGLEVEKIRELVKETRQSFRSKITDLDKSL